MKASSAKKLFSRKIQLSSGKNSIFSNNIRHLFNKSGMNEYHNSNYNFDRRSYSCPPA